MEWEWRLRFRWFGIKVWIVRYEWKGEFLALNSKRRYVMKFWRLER